MKGFELGLALLTAAALFPGGSSGQEPGNASDQTHWAWTAPVPPAVPGSTPTAHFPLRSPIDAFVAATLLDKGFLPSEEATRESWLRRVTIDWTGLPPSPAEIVAFLADESPEAHGSVVDRLLASDAYGERMAADWLDVARYADTFGRQGDSSRVVWPWRDWVIGAFNANLPYDRFIIGQTAGDLLPEAGPKDAIATTFNRLHLQMNEAGSDQEEFRCEHVADRVETNAIAFLGLGAGCARCHDHPHDPWSTKEFYQFAGFFDKIDELGLHSRFTNAVPPPTMFVLDAGTRTRRDVLLTRIDALEAERESLRPQAAGRFEAWLETKLPPRPPVREGLLARLFSRETRTVADPVVPTDRYSFEELRDRREFDNLADASRPGSSSRHLHQKTGHPQFGQALYFPPDRDIEVILPGAGKFRRTDPFSLTFWVKLDGELDEGVLIHRTRGAVEAAHRGYEITIERNHLLFRLAHFWPGNAIGIRTTAPVPVGEWFHVAAIYDGSSRASGLRLHVNGTPVGHEIQRDHLYKDILYLEEWGDQDMAQGDGARPVPDAELTLAHRIHAKSFRGGFLDEVMVFDRDLSATEIRLAGGSLVSEPPEAWFDWYLREIDGPWRELTTKIHQLRQEENAISRTAMELMVMRESPVPRQTLVLTRGQFDERGEPVDPATPAFLHPFPGDAPRDRLGLARWYVDPANPLTARVAVNRLWQLFFGTGLVATAGDFGTRGEAPSHPELLDWLALRFVESGWDIKALCREIVLSSTYRQATVPSDPVLTAADPENRLLGRGPRLRLTAEQVRDQALAAAGILNRQIGGPPVKSYRPAPGWETGIRQADRLDPGPALYRRSLYTFWSRTTPPMDLAAFDAPSRECCVVRRNPSPNPLQALVVWNDPQFVEAARLTAESILRSEPEQGPEPDANRLAHAFRLLTSRSPDQRESGVLARLLADARAEFAAHPDRARQLLGDNGETTADPALEATEVAALTVMVRTLMGYEGTLCKL